MAVLTTVADMSDQVQKFWSPIFEQELRENALLPGLVSKQYQGDMKSFGDTVYVTEFIMPKGQRKNKSSDSDYDTFSAEAITEARKAIVCDTRISVAVKFDDLAVLQSQLGQAESSIRSGLIRSAELQLNDLIYSKVSPSTSSPDHSIASVSDCNAARLAANRTLAAQAKWPMDGAWYGLLDPVYYSDVLNATTMTSNDYVSGQPLVAGRVITQRYGWNLIEDNSAASSSPLGMAQISPTNATSDLGLFFHPAFMNLVVQKQPSFSVVDLKPNNQFGYALVLEMIVGCELANQGSKLHIVCYNA